MVCWGNQDPGGRGEAGSAVHMEGRRGAVEGSLEGSVAVLGAVAGPLEEGDQELHRPRRQVQDPAACSEQLQSASMNPDGKVIANMSKVQGD